MAVNNAINLDDSGIVGYTGGGGITAFNGSPATQYAVQVGGASASTLTNVSPSATSGVPLISQGAASNPAFGTAVVAGGGTGATTLTNHGVLIGQATSAIAATAAGSAGQVLQSGGASADPTYSTATYPATTTVNQILYSSASNAVAGLATANQAVLTTGTSGIPVLTQIATNGQIIIGSTAGAPAAGTITGTAIAVTNGSNTIALAVTGGGLTWNNVTGASQTIFSRNGYIANRATLVTFTMNATNVGDVSRIVGMGAGGWTLLPSGSQIFYYGNLASTVTTGSLSSTNAHDCIELVALSSTEIIVMSAIGNITVV